MLVIERTEYDEDFIYYARNTKKGELYITLCSWPIREGLVRRPIGGVRRFIGDSWSIHFMFLFFQIHFGLAPVYKDDV